MLFLGRHFWASQGHLQALTDTFTEYEVKLHTYNFETAQNSYRYLLKVLYLLFKILKCQNNFKICTLASVVL